MLGMMNACNLEESVEFYAAKQVETRTCATSSKTNHSEEVDMKVFIEGKEKPTVSYTKDGRKLTNGKLLHPNRTPPDQWKRLIITSAAKKALQLERKNSDKRAKKRRSFKKMKSCEVVESEGMPPPLPSVMVTSMQITTESLEKE